jgi:hypothetical protein
MGFGVSHYSGFGSDCRMYIPLSFGNLSEELIIYSSNYERVLWAMPVNYECLSSIGLCCIKIFMFLIWCLSFCLTKSVASVVAFLPSSFPLSTFVFILLYQQYNVFLSYLSWRILESIY